MKFKIGQVIKRENADINIIGIIIAINTSIIDYICIHSPNKNLIGERQCFNPYSVVGNIKILSEYPAKACILLYAAPEVLPLIEEIKENIQFSKSITNQD